MNKDYTLTGVFQKPASCTQKLCASAAHVLVSLLLYFGLLTTAVYAAEHEMELKEEWPQFEAASPSWLVDVAENRGGYSIDSELMPSAKEGPLCIQLILPREDGIKYSIQGQGSDVRVPGSPAPDATCIYDQSPKDPALTFNVYVSIPDLVRRELQLPPSTLTTRISLLSGLEGPITAVAALAWKLEVKNQRGSWIDLGGINREEGSRGTWVRDPSVPGNYALLLVGDIIGISSSAQRTRQSSFPDPLAISSVKFGNESGPRARELNLLSDAMPSVIDWKQGQSDVDMYLQVLGKVSSPESGFICLRVVYQSQPRGAFRYLEKTRGNRWVVRSQTTRLANLVAPSRCQSTKQLLIPVFVNAKADQLRNRSLRFRITDVSKSAQEFDLRNATIELIEPETKSVVAALSASGETPSDGPTGRWAIESDGRVIGILDGRGVSSSRSRRIVYKGEFGDLDVKGALFKNGETWPMGEAAELTSSAQIQWDPARAKPRQILLCDREDCSGERLELPIQTNPFDIEPGVLETNLLYLIMDWRDDESITTEIASAPTSSARTNVVTQAPQAGLLFSPTIAFGSHERALTTCLGQLVMPDGTKSVVFSLRNGRQELSDSASVLSLPDDAIVTAVYSTARGGGPCPVDGLSSGDISVGEIKELAASTSVDQRLSIQQPFFAGYLHLNGAQYKQSLSRWREFIQFFNRLYSLGRDNSWWVDGVLFGASDKRNSVSTLIQPEGNFVRSLGNEEQFVAVAEAAIQNKRARVGLFESQLESLKQSVGTAATGLVYFDDLSSGCGDYIDTINSYSELNVVKGVVIAAMTENLTDSTAIRSIGGGIVDICEESDTIRVYAIDSNERSGNRDWDKALATILDDIQK